MTDKYDALIDRIAEYCHCHDLEGGRCVPCQEIDAIRELREELSKYKPLPGGVPLQQALVMLERDQLRAELVQGRGMSSAQVMEMLKLRAENAALQQHVNGISVARERELGELRADNAALAKDAARLDWLDKTGHEEGHGFCGVGYGDYRHYAHATFGRNKWPSARAAIDKAMEDA